MRNLIDTTSRLDELTIPPYQDDAGAVLARGGWHEVDGGLYSEVYEKEGKDYVLKVFSARDKAYLAFLGLIRANPNPHFPRIIGKPIQVARGYHAVRLERLAPVNLHEMSFMAYLIGQTTGVSRERNSVQYECYERTVAFLEDKPRLKQALALITDQLLPRFSNDLHAGNVMQRADGTIVIIDPVSD